MTVSTFRGIPLVLVWTMAASLVSAQITFSRDWTGGKRSGDGASHPHLAAVDCTQFSRVCRHFIQELKQAVSSQIRNKPVRPHAVDDAQLTYDDEN